MGKGMIPLIVIAKVRCLAAIYFPCGKKRKSRYYKTESQTLKRSGVIADSKLVVDDERSIRITLKAFLSEDGYNIQVAEDANQAIKLTAFPAISLVRSIQCKNFTCSLLECKGVRVVDGPLKLLNSDFSRSQIDGLCRTHHLVDHFCTEVVLFGFFLDQFGGELSHLLDFNLRQLAELHAGCLHFSNGFIGGHRGGRRSFQCEYPSS